MKMSVLRSVVFVSALLIFFAGPTFGEESNGFWPLSGEFSADATYVGEGDVERGGKHVNDFDEIDSDIRVVLTPRIKLGVLRLGAQMQPGLYNSGLGHLFWDNFNMPFVIGGTYIFSPNLQLILGVSVDVERKAPVIPAAGLRWKIGPQWLLDAVLPTPRLQYELTRDVSLYAGATVREATFRVDDDFGNTHGIPRLNHAVITYSEVRTGAGFDWKISPIVTFTGEVGYQPYRDFDFYRAEVRYHQNGGAPYGTLSLHGAF